MAFGLLRIALVVLAALAWPAAAAAEPPPGSAISQYVEVIPSASGPTFPGSAPASTPATPVALSPPARKALASQTAPRRKVLRDVATSPRYGAPQARPPVPAGVQSEAAPEGALPSAGAVAGAGGSQLPILLGLVLGAAALAGGWAIVRARR